MALFDLPLDQLEHYRPDVPEPEDFDEFWSAQLTDARANPIVLDAVPVDAGLALVDTWDVTFAGFGGHPVKAWFTRPAGAGTALLPTVVEYVGYGRGRGLPHERLLWPVAGYAHLLMDVRGQGSRYGSGGDTPDPVGSGPATPGFMTRGLRDPRDYYYVRLVVDAVRAVDAARALPGVDPAQVVAAGNSQGGGLALAVAGLVPDLRAALSSVPFMCHVGRAIGLTDQHPYGEIVEYLSVQRDAEEEALRTLSYVDGVHFARRSTAPVHMGVGLRDPVCPPSTVFAAFNHYGTSSAGGGTDGEPHKEMCVYPFNHHEGGDAVHSRRQLSWLAQELAGR